MLRLHYLLTFLLIFPFFSAVKGDANLLQALRNDPRLSEFSKFVESESGSTRLKFYLTEGICSMFVPTNEAVRKFKGKLTSAIVEYHLAHSMEELNPEVTEMNSLNPAYPKFLFSKFPSGKKSISGSENYDYYVNNAKVITANKHMRDADQILHVIDEVLVPTVSVQEKKGSSGFPDAKSLLESPKAYGLTDRQFELQLLKRRVETLNTLDTFAMEGQNTFFLPVDQGLVPFDNAKGVLDKQVIFGHIVPGHALFTRTAGATKYESHAPSNGFKLYIEVSPTNVKDTQPGGSKDKIVYYVKSEAVEDDAAQIKGTALAEIIKSNIRVANGVVHLIRKPLVKSALNIASYFQQKLVLMGEFISLIDNHYEELNTLFAQDKMFTVFVPSNSAFDLVDKKRLDATIANKKDIQRILDLHVVSGRITTVEIADDVSLRNGIKTRNPRSSLYFKVSDRNATFPKVTVDGGGVTAYIKTPNIIANNGVIHIIDRILGIPSQTVLEKLASDPTLSFTYQLISQTDLKDLFNNTHKKLTFFAPDNNAWKHIKRTMSSEYTKLFMNGTYSYHANQILQRHLISNQSLNVDSLVGLSTEDTARINKGSHRRNKLSYKMQMTRDRVYFESYVTENLGGPANRSKKESYTVYWKVKDVSAKITRPDVECVNGVIHVIDRVLMMKDDVTVSGSTQMGISSLISIVISVVLAGFF